MHKLISAAVAFVVCSLAHAEIETYLDCYYQPPDVLDPAVPDFNDGTYYTIDLRVHVTNNDDWSSTAALATIDAGLFFDHPLNDDTVPPAASVALYPAMEWDSFYLTTKADVTNQPPFADPAFVWNDAASQSRDTLWFITGGAGGDGDFVIARYTMKIEDAELPVTFHVTGAHTWPGWPPFELTCVIPEPAPLPVLSLGLALIRRR